MFFFYYSLFVIFCILFHFHFFVLYFILVLSKPNWVNLGLYLVCCMLLAGIANFLSELFFNCLLLYSCYLFFNICYFSFVYFFVCFICYFLFVLLFLFFFINLLIFVGCFLSFIFFICCLWFVICYYLLFGGVFFICFFYSLQFVISNFLFVARY